MERPIDMAMSELRSLVTKAARGAGLSWGLAEEAGWAAEWLARRGLPAGSWAALWLAHAVKGAPDPVTFGAALADRFSGATDPLPPQEVPEGLPSPGYLLPFLATIAQHRGPLEIATPAAMAASIAPDGTITLGPCWSDHPQDWRIQPAPAQQDRTRARLSPSLIDCLETLALRTTVPPSAASRRDAGAATTDND